MPRVDEIIREFMQILPTQFDENQTIVDMVEELERLNLELTCLISFDERLKSFTPEERNPNSISTKLMEAADVSNKLILPTDQGFQLWRLFETDDYKKLKKAQSVMESIAMNIIEKRKQKFDADGDSLIDQYLKNPNIDEKDIIGMSCDLLLGGVHTTSFTTGCALYHISKNKKIQSLMHEEAKKVLPNINDEITPSIMNSEIPYTRAVLKEVLRLNPISIGIGRILNHDTVLGGYLVPKNVRSIKIY